MGGTSVVRDELSHKAAELSTELVSTAYRLCTEASDDTLFNLSLYPITLERSARLNQATLDYEAALLHADQAYEEELNKLHEEWQTGRERVKERLLEGIEERRRRAREDKDGDGILNELTLDAQSRQHITRKFRHQLHAAGLSPPQSTAPLLTVTSNNHLYPSSVHSLRVEEIPSPFPLALTSMVLPPPPTIGPTTNTGNTAIAGGGGKRGKGKGGVPKEGGNAGGAPQRPVWFPHTLSSARDNEVDLDLGDIRRASKRKRGAAATSNRV